MTPLKEQPICLLLDSRQFGGIESHVLALAKALKAAGHTVCVVFCRPTASHPLFPSLQALGIDWHCLPTAPLACLQALRALHPGLIHSHGYHAGIKGRLLGRWLHVPVVSTYHAGEPGVGRVRLYQWLDYLLAPLAQVRLAVSEAIRARLPGGICLNNFVHLPATVCPGEQIAFVGRLCEDKGAELLPALARAIAPAQLHVYGDGPLAGLIRQQAPDNLICHGQTDMGQHWPRIGLLLMPSRHEGLPMAALESGAHGIPVACFAVGDLPRLIHDGHNGWLLAPADLVGLARRAQQWLALPAHERQQLALRSQQQVANHYSPQVVLPQLLALYRQARHKLNRSGPQAMQTH